MVTRRITAASNLSSSYAAQKETCWGLLRPATESEKPSDIYEVERETLSVRGFVPERIVISTVLDPYLPLKALSQYSGLSVRTLQGHINAAPSEALPAYRLSAGKVLVRRSEFDQWLAAYRTVGRPAVAEIVARLREVQRGGDVQAQG
jgi:hypothetical protein